MVTLDKLRIDMEKQLAFDKDIHTVFSIQKSIAQSGGKKSVFSAGAEDKKNSTN